MEGLYQTLPYPYLSQTNHHEYPNHHSPTEGAAHTPLMMYRPTLERPFGLEENSNTTLHWPGYSGQPPAAPPAQQQPAQPPHRHHYHHHHGNSPVHPTGYGCYGNTNPLVMATPSRPKVTTNIWEDEGTVCYQVDAKGICVARREDNDMINGTKLLNVVGMSRGKRDGILKNEKGRVVVKVGAMHLKGVWIPFQRARELATKFKILEFLYPLFTDDPSAFLCHPINTTHNEITDKTKLAAAAAAAHHFRPSLDYHWKSQSYLGHYPHMIPRSHSDDLKSTEESPSSSYDYYPRGSFQSRHSSLSSSHFYPSQETEDNKLFYVEKEPKESPTTPNSWYSPETPTAVLYQQQQKRKLSTEETPIRHPKKVKVLQVE
ncbi:transcription regulator HTH, apses-type DNA-binding domain-containing protein [Sporodiniella umbellata]|nr:transcription regulator HTH, apses-type DNA-binding domain-containing protein [Sporodiniella umbellata]